MRVIPVLDLQAGRAVRARGGTRGEYAPGPSVLVAEQRTGDAVALARAFRRRLGCDECYVADLDGITGGHPQRALVRSLARTGVRLLVDDGTADPEHARALLSDGVERVIVGLETLPDFDALPAIASAVGTERAVFSLDLQNGRPKLSLGARHDGSPGALAHAAVAAGVPALLVLDLARVGSGAGPDLSLVGELRRAHPTLELLVGGGIGSRADLERLADAGCNGALVATALHDGRLGRQDLEAVRRRVAHPSDSRYVAD
ncbi:MAG TPA: HisA/HisF-related TIM barrel protein [Gemmatimonadales bacterium]|nr:HisA/HisF-related TIM barrel protein [Gemmatimonadales bacterium]